MIGPAAEAAGDGEHEGTYADPIRERVEGNDGSPAHWGTLPDRWWLCRGFGNPTAFKRNRYTLGDPGGLLHGATRDTDPGHLCDVNARSGHVDGGSRSR
jgi:hypothetical protein